MNKDIYICSATILLAALSCALFSWVLLDVLDERELRDRYESESREAAARATYTSSVRSLVRDTRSERAELARLTDGADAVEAIGVLEGLAKDAGVPVSISSVRASVVQDESAIVINMRAVGTFTNLFHLLQLLEVAPVLSAVDTASFEKERSSSNWALISSVRIYTESVE